jgi:hypothetical protein
VLGGLKPELNLGFSGYYGSMDWNQYYDWWEPGRPAWMRD